MTTKRRRQCPELDKGWKQATYRFSLLVSSFGKVDRHFSSARLHRGAKAHPMGRFRGLGISPLRVRSRSRLPGSIEGTESSKARVYGCFGSANTASTDPNSTIRPRYITITRFERYSTVARS